MYMLYRDHLMYSYIYTIPSIVYSTVIVLLCSPIYCFALSWTCVCVSSYNVTALCVCVYRHTTDRERGRKNLLHPTNGYIQHTVVQTHIKLAFFKSPMLPPAIVIASVHLPEKRRRRRWVYSSI